MKEYQSLKDTNKQFKSQVRIGFVLEKYFMKHIYMSLMVALCCSWLRRQRLRPRKLHQPRLRHQHLYHKICHCPNTKKPHLQHSSGHLSCNLLILSMHSLLLKTLLDHKIQYQAMANHIHFKNIEILRVRVQMAKTLPHILFQVLCSSLSLIMGINLPWISVV